MTIAELLAATGLTENDLVPIYDVEAAQNVEPTQKVTAAQLAAAVKVLASLVNTTEMNAAIQQSTAYTTGSVTPVGSGSSAQFMVVKQFGKVVSLYGAITGVTVGSNIKIGTISGVSAPATTVRTLCGVAANAYDHPQDVAYLSIYTTGEIYVASTQTGTKAVYFAVTYIA
jgi:hypothetical protein